jgi:2-polyprenyl-3-methyl-5-hydroxy-6-metoxy-1,4-benzoquinol methylase
VDPTGERLVPDVQRDELIYAEHLARYRLAAQYVPGQRVLDAGCGEGYGTALLASAGAAGVVGVDVDEATIEHARERYELDFEVADVAELSFEDGSFDVVVCFETIEHVQDAPRVVAELRRVLSDDGVLVISTPNPSEYVAENEFHVREYPPAEFAEMLAAHFPQRVRLYQHNLLLSAILDEEQIRAGDEFPLDVEVRKTARLEPGRELYSVVVCGSKAAPHQVAVASGIYEAHDMAGKVRAWQERSQIAERQRQAWEVRATTAEHQREEWERRAHEAERQVGEAREHAKHMEEALQRTNEALRAVDEALRAVVESLSWRITRPLRWIGARLPFR